MQLIKDLQKNEETLTKIEIKKQRSLNSFFRIERCRRKRKEGQIYLIYVVKVNDQFQSDKDFIYLLQITLYILKENNDINCVVNCIMTSSCTLYLLNIWSISLSKVSAMLHHRKYSKIQVYFYINLLFQKVHKIAKPFAFNITT